MDELVRWLRAQLDEDERIARATEWCAGTRTFNGWDTARVDEVDWEIRSRNAVIGSGLGEEFARHIVAHDPARVLREVDADRALLDEYSRLLDANAAHQREAARLTEAGDDADVIQLAALRREADYLPAMLHALERWAKRKASVYADRPSYREAWRP